jgi:hypothetical protein
MKKITFILLISVSLTGCEELYNMTRQTLKDPSQQEIATGMKESLLVGAENAIKNLSAKGGFSSNELVRISFPPEAQRMESALRNIGLNNAVDRFVATMNESAEIASGYAFDIFAGAVRQMTFNDVMEIFLGPEDAATQYLKRTTSGQLESAFNPVIKNAIDQVELTALWNPLVSTYNDIPFTRPVNPNLEEYITEQAMNGIFLMVAGEEAKIRENPQARINDILKRVFNYRDRQMEK